MQTVRRITNEILGVKRLIGDIVVTLTSNITHLLKIYEKSDFQLGSHLTEMSLIAEISKDIKRFL